MHRACLLVDQNTHEDVDEYSIRQHMTMEYVLLGENEKGIELLKKDNPCGLTLIGMRLAVDSGLKPEDQSTHLEKNEAVLWAMRAWVQLELGQPETAKAYLRTARKLAF